MRIAQACRRLDLVLLEDRVNPVANDLFADAEVLTGQTAYIPSAANYDIFGTGEPFTGEPGEPDHAGVSDPVQSAWYRWTAPISGRAYVESYNFFFEIDKVYAVYTGDTVDDLTEVGSVVKAYDTRLTFDAVAGTTYSIAVDSRGDALIEFDLRVAVFEPPANDDFADALVLSGAPAPVTLGPSSSLAGSSTEAGEPNHAAGIDFGGGTDLDIGPSVWYSWTAPTTGRVTLDLDIAHDFDFFFAASAAAVYTGGSVGGLTLVANAGDFGPLRLSFDAVAGTTYRIAASGFGSFPSVIDIKLVNGAVPGTVAIDGTLYVVGTAKSDVVKVTPAGSADDGSTGVRVKTDLGGQKATRTFAGPLAAVEMFLFDGNNSAELSGSLTFPVEAEFGNGHDTFRGSRGNTVVRAGDGNNLIRTGDGVDWVQAGDGNNDVRTGGGDDTVVVRYGNNTITTGDGNDFVSAGLQSAFETGPSPGTGRNVIDTGAGDDFAVVFSDGPSVVTTGAGDDFVNMQWGSGSDLIRTGDGNDWVNAGRGHNVVFTGAGNDTISAGFETYVGGPNPDETWSNFIDAGDGNDSVQVNGNGPSVVFAGAGDDDVTIGFQFSFGPDPLAPLTGPAVVFGGEGDDVLMGGAGNDRLDGGAGRDVLVGGLGADVLLGGLGSDVLFDGTVAVIGADPFFPPQLRPVFASWDPADPVSYQAVRDQIEVTPDTASRDVLLGGSGIDWFWSDDPLDLLDITPVEVRN